MKSGGGGGGWLREDDEATSDTRGRSVRQPSSEHSEIQQTTTLPSVSIQSSHRDDVWMADGSVQRGEWGLNVLVVGIWKGIHGVRQGEGRCMLNEYVAATAAVAEDVLDLVDRKWKSFISLACAAAAAAASVDRRKKGSRSHFRTQVQRPNEYGGRDFWKCQKERKGIWSLKLALMSDECR